MGYSDTPSIAIVEIGEIRLFRFTPSTAWLPMAGGTFNHNDYPLLGALYGSSAGGTFTLEDFRGRALYGADGTNLAGTIAGTDTVDLTHGHGTGTIATATGGAHNHGGTTGASGSQAVGTLSLLSSAAPPNHTHTIPQDTGHTHSLSGSTASALTSVDKRAARGYALLYIRAKE